MDTAVFGSCQRMAPRRWTRFSVVAQHPGLPLVEMDTVEGIKGGKVLLTLMFFPYGFMLAFLLPDKTAASVKVILRNGHPILENDQNSSSPMDATLFHRATRLFREFHADWR